MSAGQEFVKKIRPLGVALFLILFVLFLYICFTAGANPIPGYESPHDSAYYSQNDSTLEELKTELEANVFPKLSGEENCSVADGKLSIVIESSSFATSRSAILRYYDESLFEFIKGES